jgi:hypothetical protein
VEKSEPVAFCKICTGPIYTGEPVVSYDDGLAHLIRMAVKGATQEEVNTGEENSKPSEKHRAKEAR